MYPKIDKRETLVQIIRAPLPRPTDTVEIPSAAWERPAFNQINLIIPLQSGAAAVDALSVSVAGLYPVQIAVRIGNKTLSAMLTFINRVGALTVDDSDTDPMAIGMAIGTHSTIRVDHTGASRLETAAIDEMTRLAESLEAIGTKMPVTIRVDPGVAASLQRTDPALFDRLVAHLQQQQLIAEPLWPFDPSAAAAAGQQTLYTTWLRDGASSLSGLVNSPISRGTIFADQPISADGAELRSNLGASLMVMTPATYYDLDGAINDYSDYFGELFAAELSGDESIDAAVIDNEISELLSTASPVPAQVAVYAVAHLLATRQGVEASGGTARRHAVVIAMPDLGVPPADLIGRIAALIAETPGLRATGLDEIGLNTDRYVSDGQEQRITLPQVDGVAVQERSSKRATITNEIDVVASMLPADDGRPADWRIQRCPAAHQCPGRDRSEHDVGRHTQPTHGPTPSSASARRSPPSTCPVGAAPFVCASSTTPTCRCRSRCS